MTRSQQPAGGTQHLAGQGILRSKDPPGWESAYAANQSAVYTADIVLQQTVLACNLERKGSSRCFRCPGLLNNACCSPAL